MQSQALRALRIRPRFLSGLLALSSLLAADAAAQCTVTVPSNPNPVVAGAALQAAINAAGAGSVICIDAGTYQGPFTINGSSITLQPSGAALSVVLDGGGAGPVLSLLNCTNATLVSGLLIQNGQANDGGGILILDGSPVVSGCRVENNLAWSRGGGIAVWGQTARSAPRISSTYVVANQAWGNGGGIAFIGNTGSLTLFPSAILTNSTVRLNQAGVAGPALGGGIYAGIDFGTGLMPQVSISRCRINENSVDGSGGGAAFHYGVALDFDHDWILQNSATNDGGGVWNDHGCVFTMRSCHVEENQAAFLGGGVYVRLYDSGEIRNSTIDMNLLTDPASLGGGVYISNVGGAYNGGNTAKGSGPPPPVGAPPMFLVRNNLIVTNQSADGAGVTVESATPLFSFNTFNLNLATVGATGGMLVNNPFGYVTALTVRNSIYWGDVGTAAPVNPWDVEFLDLGTLSTLTSNDVQGAMPGWPAQYGVPFSVPPQWVNGYTCPLAPIDGYFLSQPAPLSPCVDAGAGVLPGVLNGRSTNPTGAADTGTVDLGYHYPPTTCP